MWEASLVSGVRQPRVDKVELVWRTDNHCHDCDFDCHDGDEDLHFFSSKLFSFFPLIHIALKIILSSSKSGSLSQISIICFQSVPCKIQKRFWSWKCKLQGFFALMQGGSDFDNLDGLHHAKYDLLV